MDGYCMIPETPNNVSRLKRIGVAKKVLVKHKKFNFQTMTDDETTVEETIRPQYERVEESVVEDNIVDRIVEKLFSTLDDDKMSDLIANIRSKRGQDAAITPAPEAPTRIRPDSNVQKVPERTPVLNQAVVKATPGTVKGARRGGRPKSEVATAAT